MEEYFCVFIEENEVKSRNYLPNASTYYNTAILLLLVQLITICYLNPYARRSSAYVCMYIHIIYIFETFQQPYKGGIIVPILEMEDEAQWREVYSQD